SPASGYRDCCLIRKVFARRQSASGNTLSHIQGSDPGPTLVMGPKGCFLFASAVEYPPDALRSYDRDEYVMWGFSARRELLASRLDVAELSGDQIKGLALTQMEEWHPALRRLVERADPATMTGFEAKSAEPIAPWNTGAVTLLGDALHNMTPFRG